MILPKIIIRVLILSLSTTILTSHKGSCSDATMPTTSSMIPNFCWLLEGQVAGMAQPSKTLACAQALADINVGAIVALNGDVWSSREQQELLEFFNIEHHSYPLEDPLLCTPENTAQIKALTINLVKLTNRMTKEKKVVVVHCNLSENRTWIVLGCLFFALKAINSSRIEARNTIRTMLKARNKPSDALVFVQYLLKDSSCLSKIQSLLAKHEEPEVEAEPTGADEEHEEYRDLPYAHPPVASSPASTDHSFVAASSAAISNDYTNNTANTVRVKKSSHCCCVVQ